MDQTHYETLGVPPDADQAQIRSAFRKAMRHHHPDMANSQGDPEMATRITAAFEVLSDEARRADYNLDLRRTGQPAGQPDGQPTEQSAGNPTDKTSNTGATSQRRRAGRSWGPRPQGPVVDNSDKPKFTMPAARYTPSLLSSFGLLAALVVFNHLVPAWGIGTFWVAVPVVAGAVAAAMSGHGSTCPVPGIFVWAAALATVAVTEAGVWVLAGGPNVLVRAVHLGCAGWFTAALALSAVAANRSVAQDGWSRSLRNMNLFGQEPSSTADVAVHAAVSRLFGDAAVRVMVNTERAFSHVVTRGDRAVFVRGVMCGSGTVRWDGSTLVQDHRGSATAVTFREFDSFAQLTLARVPDVRAMFLVALFTSDGRPVTVSGQSPSGVQAVDGAMLAAGLSDFLGGGEHVVDVEKTAAAFERMT